MKELEKEKQRIQKALEKLQKEKEAHEDGLKTAMADGNATREAFYMNQITAIRNQILEKEKQITAIRNEITAIMNQILEKEKQITKRMPKALESKWRKSETAVNVANAVLACTGPVASPGDIDVWKIAALEPLLAVDTLFVRDSTRSVMKPIEQFLGETKFSPLAIVLSNAGIGKSTGVLGYAFVQKLREGKNVVLELRHAGVAYFFKNTGSSEKPTYECGERRLVLPDVPDHPILEDPESYYLIDAGYNDKAPESFYKARAVFFASPDPKRY